MLYVRVYLKYQVSLPKFIANQHLKTIPAMKQKWCGGHEKQYFRGLSRKLITNAKINVHKVKVCLKRSLIIFYLMKSRLKLADILIMKFGKGGFNRQTATFSYPSVSKSRSFDI